MMKKLLHRSRAIAGAVGLLALLFATLLAPTDVDAGELLVSYVNLDKVLDEYLDLKEAKEELNRNIGEWRTTRDSIKQVIDTMRSNFDQERPMLSDEAKISRERAIEDMEEEYQQYWRSVWGDGGKVDLKTRELVEPLTQKVQEVINEMAEESEFDLVLDISAEGVVYARQEDNITDLVIDELNKDYVQKDRVGEEFKPLVACLPFKEGDDVAKQRNLGAQLVMAFWNGINATPKFRPIETAVVNDELDRQGITIEIIDFDAAKTIAEDVGAELFVFGTVTKEGDDVVIDAALYRVADGSVIYEQTETSQDLYQMITVAVENMAMAMSAAYSGEGK
jgi:outer membrane protein